MRTRDLVFDNDVTVNDLERAWEESNSGEKFYVEVDLEGDARFVGPMSLHQAKLLKHYSEKEALDDDGNLDLRRVIVVDEIEHQAYVSGLGGSDPMGIGFFDYVSQNEDFDDFLRNR